MSVPVVEPDRYPEQLEAKRQRIVEQFARFDAPAPEVFASPASHYRQRCEFRLWHDGDDLHHAMFEVDPADPKQKTVIRLTQYPVASRRINELMPQLIEAVRDNPILRHRLFQVEYLTTLTGEALITLIYHRRLDERWDEEARALEQQLDAAIIGRARKQRRVLTRDHVTEHLEVDGQVFHYQQVENSFTQPNAEIARSMLHWAREVTRARHGGRRSRDLVELYCGNGHFTIALAENFRRVAATEISRTSVASAQVNLASNAIDNAVVVRMSSEEFGAALDGEKEGNRVNELALTEHDFATVLVDPPRAGLDEASCARIARFDEIVYISCNPATLAANLEQLTQTHTVERLALFDQFPWTDHCECGVLLRRRGDQATAPAHAGCS
ncbi:tRNA (uridine(54)-C5)-methyltransferase TrmA [Kushneria phosphatilytica]|uniref:tRNA/tmRNA (uracil-C(5))-methyltransferase n=1 Tax=Kushneria phosphatilytica TaxID=657387 RepID=A0A1S1NUM6_9GAMM|nr:tRNA (uridine(54)-C5)-methyltransferase TrmA [Kushneria phosphatilytica]OHV09926.1 tRNA (uridine(54)-C5)-methyltransferase TrmA [Kushneria phosphatilytica]QEL11593.1 tRNA (uridine(54)-C5)-methyltransferase TrmA [Kushneria phosphatilytica]